METVEGFEPPITGLQPVALDHLAIPSYNFQIVGAGVKIRLTAT